MKFTPLAVLGVIALAGAAQAGDAASGADLFSKRCKSCHMIQSPDGTEVVKGGRTGPNLWGLVGRAAASAEDFSRYGDGIKAASAAGLVWDEAGLATYVQDPRAFIREASGDPKARSNMSYKLSKEDQAADVAAYLATLQ